MSDVLVGLTTGSRVAVRSRIDPPPPHGPSLTDTVGEIVGLDEHTLQIRSRTGVVTLRRELVTAARAIPPKPSRRGAPHRAITIEDLHLVMTKGQPGIEESWLGTRGEGWLLRAGRGWTGRSNSALPVGDPGLPLAAAVDAVERWYDERGLAPLFMLPRPRGAAMREDPLGELLLARAGYRAGMAADVLTGRTDTIVQDPVPSPSGLSLRTSATVDEAWLTGGSPRILEHLDAARQILALPSRQVFLTAQDDEGGTAGVVRVALDDGWAGTFGLHVAPAHRRRGIGRWLTVEAARVAAATGATLTYLQVERANTAAHDLYTSLGMGVHHEYAYLGRPRA